MTTLSDLKTTVEGLCALADRAIALGQGIIPGRINQDVLENWFGHHRHAGGSNQNMTGMPSSYAFQLHNITFEAESSLIYEHVYFQVVKA